ncbi:EutP/PduV family microcompartment system protein [Furfurilactobacillus rossiae]|uniref:Propanediol utilization protein PduV n=1 Tax=Furfurilactobacillus rossiae DSM 15814 TaxID=1114972 RepID=A0A0R1RGX3_9LACO|nr:EutP/PduV family microcompartment system protein [Furfurilactobacillus rossiae]KRL56119.1 propanediol utilization protein PduV [Furfurilactobacillus rossiae DSM 15814]MCF6166622.1 EutP/PduV family microcompartment system protein [Furfurilactobacillus rossiae]QFR66145.1 EutP/PduV family microcompartment system protein [Furfurilactobacillus rossiae]QLE61575.1 Propanediol utilization protein PduV [Furfurilactobacillus rossiae]QLE64370.1 Propanediol utilization protein PduV [Furfurilactobacillu
MKRPLLVGAVGCGKTTLHQRLTGALIKYDKTQSVEFFKDAIDTPGEFVEHHRFYSALSVTAADVDLILMLQSVLDRRQIFAPGFATMFNKPVVGIVTKVDLADSVTQIEASAKYLRSAGAKTVILSSAVKDIGTLNVEHVLEMK